MRRRKKKELEKSEIKVMVHTKRPEDKYACSKCNSSHVDIYNHDNHKHISCLDCGQEDEMKE